MNCPECNAVIDLEVAAGSLGDFEDGDFLDCPECEQTLEVVFLDGGGMVLELAPNFPEDIEW